MLLIVNFVSSAIIKLPIFQGRPSCLTSPSPLSLPSALCPILPHTAEETGCLVLFRKARLACCSRCVLRVALLVVEACELGHGGLWWLQMSVGF